MDFKEYQKLAQRTANKQQTSLERLMIAGLGLAGESGEVAEIIKKYAGHGHEMSVDSLINELGDVMWYIQEIASIFNIPLEHIADVNIEKLKMRYPDGFSTERSINREV